MREQPEIVHPRVTAGDDGGRNRAELAPVRPWGERAERRFHFAECGRYRRLVRYPGEMQARRVAFVSRAEPQVVGGHRAYLRHHRRRGDDGPDLVQRLERSPGVLPVDIGWYAELEWHNIDEFDNAELEIEFKPIIEKDLGRFSLMANPTFEKPITGPDKNRGFEFGYATGIYYRWQRYLSPGLEFYGGIGLIDDSDPLSEQQHYIFPVGWGELPHGIEYSVGPGFGFTRNSDHVLVKFNVELERFIGAIFGPSSENSWFF